MIPLLFVAALESAPMSVGDRAAIVAPILGQLSDAGTTRYGVEHGFSERLMPFSDDRFVAMKLATGAGLAVWVRHEQRAGHRNRAKVIGWTGFALGMLPALWNVRQISRGH